MQLKDPQTWEEKLFWFEVVIWKASYPTFIFLVRNFAKMQRIKIKREYFVRTFWLLKILLNFQKTIEIFLSHLDYDFSLVASF
jgi:hypothetical protein